MKYVELQLAHQVDVSTSPTVINKRVRLSAPAFEITRPDVHTFIVRDATTGETFEIPATNVAAARCVAAPAKPNRKK